VVTYSHGVTGELLKSVPLGAQAKGDMAFDWTDVPADLAASRTPIRVSVSATGAEGTKTVSPQVYARVMSATSGGTAQDLTLQVEDYGAMNALEVNSIR
ncbi:MAG: flagellar biosynthesis protein FlgD, partial [Rhodobacteraceae bacterium PARR1]